VVKEMALVEEKETKVELINHGKITWVYIVNHGSLLSLVFLLSAMALMGLGMFIYFRHP